MLAAPPTAPPTTAPTATCSKCHLTTSVPQFLVKARDSFSFGLGTQPRVCPRCAAKDRRRSTYMFGGSIFLASAMIAFARVKDLSDGAPSRVPLAAVAFFPVLVLSFPLMTLFHELGHALVGRACGLKVFGISLGHGKRLHRFQFGSHFLDLRAIPLGGFCSCSPEPGKAQRWRLALMLAAGPGTHLLFLCLILGLAPAGTFVDPATRLVRMVPLTALLLVNIEKLVMNLLPRNTRFDGVVIPNDGKRILSILSRKFNPDSWVLGRFANELEMHLERRDPAEARRTLEEARPIAGKTLNFRVHELNLLAAEGNWPLVAEKCACELATETEFHKRFAFLDWGAVAGAYTRTDLDEAQRFCDEALRPLPWDPTTQTVCSAVALAKGDNVSAEKFLRQAGSDNPNWAARAAAARMWEELSRQKNNPREELKWRRRANRLDPRGVFKLPSSPAPAP